MDKANRVLGRRVAHELTAEEVVQVNGGTMCGLGLDQCSGRDPLDTTIGNVDTDAPDTTFDINFGFISGDT